MSVLIFAEHDEGKLSASFGHVLTAATVLGDQIDVVVLGENLAAVASEVSAYCGVANVQTIDSGTLTNQLAEVCAPELAALMSGYNYLLAAATTTGKNIIPRVAALCDAQPISDVMAVEGPKTFKRPIYAGNVIATVESLDDKVFMTVRTTAFDRATPSDGSAPVNSVASVNADASLSAFVGEQKAESDRPELTAAEVVISGGRGLQNGDNFELLYKLADKVNAAVGASRAAVDAGFVPNDMQVGQTGKIVAPSLYVAVGISGAIQHLAGMKDSKVIVAINKDEDAPIFQVADYGLVADLFDVLPELTEKLG